MESSKIGFAATGLVLAAGLFLQPYRAVVVSGRSMTPTYEDGQLVFAVPMRQKPRVNDVVLLEKDGATLIKRVAMVPGDHYQEVYIRFAHDWIPNPTRAMLQMAKAGRLPIRTQTVPDGKIYITGDNPDLSMDSRFFGLVPIGSVRGLIVPVL